MGNLDTVRVAADITPQEVQLRRVSGNNDLVVELIGTNDRMTLQNWFLDDRYRIEQVVLERESAV